MLNAYRWDTEARTSFTRSTVQSCVFQPRVQRGISEDVIASKMRNAKWQHSKHEQSCFSPANIPKKASSEDPLELNRLLPHYHNPFLLISKNNSATISHTPWQKDSSLPSRRHCRCRRLLLLFLTGSPYLLKSAILTPSPEAGAKSIVPTSSHSAKSAAAADLLRRLPY